jgi:hypothetical protein
MDMMMKKIIIPGKTASRGIAGYPLPTNLQLGGLRQSIQKLSWDWYKTLSAIDTPDMLISFNLG